MEKLQHSIAIGLAAGLFVVACGGASAPASELAEARGALSAAEAIGAAQHPDAVLHLKLARDAIDRAEAHMARGDNALAARELERARADAELAEAVTRRAETEQRLDEATTRLEALDDTSPDGP